MCYACTSNKHMNMPYGGKQENQDVSCFHARVYTYIYMCIGMHGGKIYVHVFIYVNMCLCTYLYVNRHFQSPEPQMNRWVRWQRAERITETGATFLHGKASGWRRSWRRGECCAAAAGDRSRRLQQELCKFLTPHSWLGTENWKSTFLSKVKAGGLISS